jgi:tRNA(His) 5'-end guanylyltransferase
MFWVKLSFASSRAKQSNKKKLNLSRWYIIFQTECENSGFHSRQDEAWQACVSSWRLDIGYADGITGKIDDTLVLALQWER